MWAACGVTEGQPKEPADEGGQQGQRRLPVTKFHPSCELPGEVFSLPEGLWRSCPEEGELRRSVPVDRFRVKPQDF